MEQLTHQQDYEGKQIQGSRHYQEDDFGFDATYADTFVMVLADGMGGYVGGDTASHTTIITFLDTFNPKSKSSHTASEQLDTAMQAANHMLAKTIKEKPELEGMGCTLVGAVLSNDFTHLHWISIGDSPFWLIRKGQLQRLNEDHSRRAELLEWVKKGEITLEQAESAPQRNALTSALIGEPPALIDHNSKILEAGDILLLASDGILTLNDAEIESIMKQANHSAEKLTDDLLAAVSNKAHSGQDNTTALVVKIPNIADHTQSHTAPSSTMKHAEERLVAPASNAKSNPKTTIRTENKLDHQREVEKSSKESTLSKTISKLLTYVIIGLVAVLVVVGIYLAGSSLFEEERPPLKVNGGREAAPVIQPLFDKTDEATKGVVK